MVQALLFSDYVQVGAEEEAAGVVRAQEVLARVSSSASRGLGVP